MSDAVDPLMESFDEQQKRIVRVQEIAQECNQKMDQFEQGSTGWESVRDQRDHAMRVADQHIAFLRSQIELADFYARRQNGDDIVSKLSTIVRQLNQS